MNALIVTSVLFVLALLIRGLLVLAYANSSAHNVRKRLRQYARR